MNRCGNAALLLTFASTEDFGGWLEPVDRQGVGQTEPVYT